MSIRVDSAVRRHSWITFDPQFTLNDGLDYPPWPEQQAIRLEHDLTPPSRSTCHDSNALMDKRTAADNSAVAPGADTDTAPA